ncbi:hypothetical protein Lal_00032557, partial [Lupinus albus]
IEKEALIEINQLEKDNVQFSYSIWKSKAPLKVITFASRLFIDRIPTKIVLSRRGVTFSNGGGLLCLFCNDVSEYAFHLFSTYKSIYNWLNITVTLPQNFLHHYLNHLGLVNDKKGWKAWSFIWFATIWAIWRHRNDIIFNKTRLSINHILGTARVNA